MESEISGVWAPTLTPLQADLTIDTRLLVDHCRGMLDDGCEGVVLFGSTGEAPSFSVSERLAALDALIQGGIARDRIIVGTGCPAFPDTAELSQHATHAGVRGVLVIPPYFYKNVSEEAVIASYAMLCEAIGDDLRLYLYHFPALSMVPITPRIITRIQERFGAQLAGIKDSSGAVSSLHGFTSVEGLTVMPGTERLMLEGFRHGASGTITATANVSARIIADVWKNRAAPAVDDGSMLAARSVIEATGAVPTMKAWLANASGYEGWNRLRPPLTELVRSVALDSIASLDRVLHDGAGHAQDRR